MSASTHGTHVTVVGIGLIGGSIARRLDALARETGRPVQVTAVDVDPGTRELAAAAGLTTTATVPADSDWVIVAAPLDALPEVLAEVASAAPRAVVVDVGSVKAAPHRAALAAGLGDRYVGAHPMGGTELSGFAHAEPDLLVGVTWAIAWPDAAARHLLAPAVELVISAFDATVVVLDAAEHDRSVALVSHAPHVLANALLGVLEAADAPAARHLGAGSLRDGTRVAGRNPVRTFNMLAENSEAVAEVLDDLISELQGYRSALGEPDGAALLSRLARVAEDAAPLRSPEVAWTACPDLAAALASRAVDRSAVVLRSGAAGLEWADLSRLDPG